MIAKVCDRESRRGTWFENRLIFNVVILGCRPRVLKGKAISGGVLVFKGGYHARVQICGKRVVFQGEARTARAMFRVSKTAKIKKGYVF